MDSYFEQHFKGANEKLAIAILQQVAQMPFIWNKNERFELGKAGKHPMGLCDRSCTYTT